MSEKGSTRLISLRPSAVDVFYLYAMEIWYPANDHNIGLTLDPVTKRIRYSAAIIYP